VTKGNIAKHYTKAGGIKAAKWIAPAQSGKLDIRVIAWPFQQLESRDISGFVWSE